MGFMRDTFPLAIYGPDLWVPDLWVIEKNLFDFKH